MIIRLHEAPTKLFDPTIWTFFQLRFASYDEALKVISENPSSLSSALSSATSKSDLDRLIDGTQPYDLRSMEVQQFRRRIKIGELSATGIRSGDSRQRRVRLTRSQTKNLHFNFYNNEAVGLFQSYEQVEISENTGPTAKQQLLESVIAFLKMKKDAGIQDKVLRTMCEAHLKTEVPHRCFREALRVVFDRKPGRPRKKVHSV